MPKRKFLNSGTSSGINNSIYDNNYDYNYSTDYTVPRRRTATFSYNNNAHNAYNSYNYERKPLQRSDSFGSSLAPSIGLLAEKSSNMEKREMLMSSFNRHTNTGSNQKWLNRLKLNNLFGSSPKKVLPPRPSNFYSNYGRTNYSPYKTGTYRNYMIYDDYYRPKIRDRPLFSDIRKSVMHKTGHQLKNNRYYANNYSNNYSNKFSKNSVGGAKSNASVLSNGSSGLSSSSSGGSISYTQQSTTTTSPSETPAFSSPLQSQKSIRKVDRYRSVIKFREHNIGKTYEERKNTINWDIENEDPFANSDLLKELVGNNIVNKIDETTYTDSVDDLTNLNKEIENIWNVITDTTLLTNTSSTNTLSDRISDLNVGYEPTGDEVNKLEQQFAEIKRKKDELEELKVAVENDNLLNTGKRKLHKSVNLSSDGKNLMNLNKKSKSVKINENVMVKDIKANDLVEQINKVNGTVGRLEVKLDDQVTEKVDVDKQDDGKVKKILKTTKSLTKKPSKVKIKDEEQEDAKDANNNLIVSVSKTGEKNVSKNEEKFKNKKQSFKTLFVKPEVHFVYCNQGFKKTDYARPEVVSTSSKSLPIKTAYFKLELEKIEKRTKLVKTDYHRLELQSISKLAPLIRTDFEKPKIYITIAKSPLLNTDFASPKLVITKLIAPSIKTPYFKPTIVAVELKSDPIKTDYSRPSLHRASTRLAQFKTSYKKPELMVTQTISPPLKTNYHQFRLEQTVLHIPFGKTSYERIEWFVTKPVNCALIKTDFQSPAVQIVELKTKLIKTDYVYLPVQSVVSKQNYLKTDYFRVPTETVQIKLGNCKTDFHKVPVLEINLKINCFASLDFQSPAELISPTSAKPPLNLSVKNQLNQANRLPPSDQLVKASASLKSESTIQSTLSSIKSVLSLNNNEPKELKRLESKESVDEAGKKKVKKVKKVKVAKKASSVSGTNNENKLPEIIQPNENQQVNRTNDYGDELNELHPDYLAVNDKRKLLIRSVSLDHQQNSQSKTFQNATASKEQYRLPQKKRIKFRNYNIDDFYLQSVLGRGKF